jgi:hypothetical protein
MRQIKLWSIFVGAVAFCMVCEVGRAETIAQVNDILSNNPNYATGSNGDWSASADLSSGTFTITGVEIQAGANPFFYDMDFSSPDFENSNYAEQVGGQNVTDIEDLQGNDQPGTLDISVSGADVLTGTGGTGTLSEQIDESYNEDASSNTPEMQTIFSSSTLLLFQQNPMDSEEYYFAFQEGTNGPIVGGLIEDFPLDGGDIKTAATPLPAPASTSIILLSGLALWRLDRRLRHA